MNNLGKKMVNATLISAFIFATHFLVGCGDSEMVKEMTATAGKEKFEKNSDEDSSEEKDGFMLNFNDWLMRVSNGEDHG